MASKEVKKVDEDKKVLAAYAGDIDESQAVKRDEQAVPFLRIIQSNSPQLNPSHAKYIEAAKPGMILNTATNELYSAVAGVIAHRDHNYVEYVPRDSGGGFVGIWAKDDQRIAPLRAAQGQFGKLKLESGNELTETYYTMGPVVGKRLDGTMTEPFEAVIGFASTQIKKFKQMMSRLSSLMGIPQKYPQFAFRWLFFTVGESNKKGSFFGWKIALDGMSSAEALLPPNDPLYLRARAFAAEMREGARSVDYAQAEVDDAAEGGAVIDNEEEEIPM